MSKSNNNSFARLQPVAHYFKSDFPDQRFLPVRLFLHSRKAKDRIPSIHYFESFYPKKKIPKKVKTGLSPLRSNRIFENKEKIYCELFTNGEVDIRTDYSPSNLVETGALSGKHRVRLITLTAKGRTKSQKRGGLGQLVDSSKKKLLISNRILKNHGK